MNLQEERLTGLGGSDIAGIFNMGYGCALRVWRDKRGQSPDNPDEDAPLLELGHVLEPFFAKRYEKLTGRQVHPEPMHRHPDIPYLLVHTDRGIIDPERPDMGVLEIKAVGRNVFYKMKRQGVTEDYVLQLQHGLLVTGRKWGEFAIGNRDSGELLPPTRIEADPEVHKAILDHAPVFWAQVENGPAPDLLDPDDPRCEWCRYRNSCQGAALAPVREREGDYTVDETMAPLFRELIERKALLKEAKELCEETEEEIKAKLGDRTMVSAGGARVQFYSYTKRSYTVKEQTVRPLRIYAPKENS